MQERGRPGTGADGVEAVMRKECGQQDSLIRLHDHHISAWVSVEKVKRTETRIHSQGNMVASRVSSKLLHVVHVVCCAFHQVLGGCVNRKVCVSDQIGVTGVSDSIASLYRASCRLGSQFLEPCFCRPAFVAMTLFLSPCFCRPAFVALLLSPCFCRPEVGFENWYWWINQGTSFAGAMGKPNE